MSGGAGAVMAAGDVITSVLNYAINDELARFQHLRNKELMDRQNQWSLDQWNRTNEYNTPLAQRQRLEDAGLNPLYYGLDGSNAQSFESAQALGYQRPEVQVSNPAKGYFEGEAAKKQVELAQKQIDNLQSQIDNRDEETKGLRLDNEFKDKTLNARVEGEEVSTRILREKEKEVKESINQIKQNIKESIERANTEVEKRNLLIAQSAVQKATEKQILELLPYQQNLMSAQTAAQKAAASASMYNALYTKGLIDNGQIDLLCNELRSRIQANNAAKEKTLQETAYVKKETAYLAERTANEAANRLINDFKASIRTGNAFTIYDTDYPVIVQAKEITNAIFQDACIIGEALVGPLSGLFK